MINVTKTFLPSQQEFNDILSQPWESSWLTNRGPLVCTLEDRINEYLGTSHVLAMANGTLPLQIAIKALDLKGEIITTPFSYVATTSAIVWENCTPVFVDIDPEYLTIDEAKIEAVITDKTDAILATHVFGNACNVDVIESIAHKYNLKVIYDAAHCFGVKYKGQSLFNYGDVSTCSFHATKLFHTGEGGAAFCNDESILHELFYHHNFGHDGPTDFFGLGINGKMSELHAALGLSVLPYMSHILAERKAVVDYYNNQLNFERIRTLKLRSGIEWNYAYYPIIFEDEGDLIKVKDELKNSGVNTRRYFYPSLEDLPYTNSNNCSVARIIASRVLCLPLYVGLSQNQLNKIVKIINS